MTAQKNPATNRGRVIAHLLAGAWGSPPPPPAISPEALRDSLAILERQGSAGLAWARIRNTSLAETPGASRLRNAYRHHTLEARLREQQLLDAVGYLRSHGVEPVLAKGWALGRLYPEPGLRPYGDLDLWVPPWELRRCREALRNPERPPVPVELHVGFNELADRSPRALLDRSRVETLDGTAVRVFGPEDHLRLVGLHALEHGLARPLWLCDVAVLLEHLPKGFQWERAMEGDPWLTEGFRCSLHLARELLGVNLAGAGVPGMWRETPIPGWLVPAALTAFGARTHYMEVPDPSELLLKPGALLRAGSLRWANPLEATFRRRAPWNTRSRWPYQALDFLLRSGNFFLRSPAHLIRLLKR